MSIDIFVITKEYLNTNLSFLPVNHFSIFHNIRQLLDRTSVTEVADDYRCQFAIEIFYTWILPYEKSLDWIKVKFRGSVWFSFRFHWNQMLTWIDLTLEGPVLTFPFWQKKFIWRLKETFWPQPSFHICLDFKDSRITQTNPVNSRIRFSKSFLDLVLKWFI